MKQIIATIRDGSKVPYKIVRDDFDIGAWVEKRKHNLRLLGIMDIQMEEIEESP